MKRTASTTFLRAARSRVARRERPQRAIGKDGPGPRPEVLGRDVAPGDLAQVGVHVVRRDVVRLAVVADVLEELLAGQVLAAPDDRGQPSVADPDLMLAAGLAAESEADACPAHRCVAILERRQAERAVEPGVLVVADPDQGQLEQLDDGRQDLLPRHPGLRQVGVAALADPRQDPSEVDEALELGVVAPGPPEVVVAVLLATLGITAGRLEVAGGIRADPDVGPGRRDRQRPEPGEDRPVADQLAIGAAIAEPAAAPLPGDARPSVGRVAESGGARGGASIGLGQGVGVDGGHRRTVQPRTAVESGAPRPFPSHERCRLRYRCDSGTGTTRVSATARRALSRGRVADRDPTPWRPTC